MFRRRIEFELVALWVLWGTLLGYGAPSQTLRPAPQDNVASSDAAATTTTPASRYADSVGTGNRIEILPETQEASNDLYVQHLLTQLKKSWLAFIPDEARNGAPAKVKVVFEILPDGKLPKGDPQIESGSGIASLDKAAIYAIRYWHQYDPLPAGFHGPTLKLRINFLYNAQTTTPIEIPSTAAARTAQTPGDSSNASDESYGVTILSDTYGVDLAPYVQRLRKEIGTYWYTWMPEDAKLGAKGKVSVLLEILRDGNLSTGDPQIEAGGSGIADLDTAAMNAIRHSVPFAPLPQQFHGPYLKLRLVFLYNIKPSAEVFKTPAGKE